MVRRLALAPLLLLLPLVPSAYAAYPGANGRIAFVREPAPGQPEAPDQVFGVSADGSGLQPITSVDSDDPAFSPNGRLIAYMAADAADPNQSRIWVANADGSQPHEIALASGVTYDDGDPSWSPDGTRLVFIRQIYDSMMHITSSPLVIASADGSGPGTAIPGSDDDVSPAWSPDGGRIAVAHNTGGDPLYEIDVMNVDGSNRKTLDSPPTPGTQDNAPAWSPDGRTVWFDRGAEAVGCLSGSQIYAVPSDGSAGAALVSKDPSLSDYEAAPSPDGSKVAFVRCDDPTDGIHHIYTMNLDGTGAVPATSGTTVDDYTPDWQPSAPLFASGPSISGKSVNNQTLTATAGVASAGATVLQFERCNSQGAACVAIAGAVAAGARSAASSATYKLTSADLGHTIRVRQTQTNQAGSTAVESPQTGSVVPSRGRCSNRFAGTSKADQLRGSSGSDRLSGGRGRDKLFGLGGSDCISGGTSNDTLSGGSGNDTVNGDKGSDRLSGGKGNDKLSGGSGNDRISGGPGRNKVSGGSGNDTINVRNHKRDIVNCGSGRKDRVVADRGDRLRHCERVKRRK